MDEILETGRIFDFSPSYRIDTFELQLSFAQNEAYQIKSLRT